MSDEEKPLAEYTRNDAMEVGRKALAELDQERSGEHREQLTERCLEVLHHLSQYTDDEKRRMYLAGEYEHPPPPFNPSEWNEESWIMYINSYGTWEPSDRTD